MSLHILPTWRTVPLAKITFEDLSEWVAHLSAGDLGPSGIRQSVFVMSAALDHAERSGRIRANPARGLGLPRVQRRDYIFLTHEQLHELSSAAESWRVFVLLLGYTGLRWSEATALRVYDVDLGRRRIDVRRAFPMSAGASSWVPRNPTSPALSRSRGFWSARSLWPCRARILTT